MVIMLFIHNFCFSQGELHNPKIIFTTLLSMKCAI